VSVATDIVLLDLNTPQEYERALRRYRSTPA
jgi:CTP:molybdopterin cytidylyltransferase MocA